MNKKIMRIIFTGLIAVFISGTILMPTIATVFAAEQTSDQDQQAPPPPPPPPSTDDAQKDGDNEHSGHDMHDMKNM